MKDIIALATVFCLIGGIGMAAEHNGEKRPRAAINGDEWSRNNQQDRSAAGIPIRTATIPTNAQAGINMTAFR